MFLLILSIMSHVKSYAKMKKVAMVARAVRGAKLPVILITPLPTAFAKLSLHLINQIVIISRYIIMSILTQQPSSSMSLSRSPPCSHQKFPLVCLSHRMRQWSYPLSLNKDADALC